MSFAESEKYVVPCECGTGEMKKTLVNQFNVKYKGNWFSKNKTY